MWGELLFKHKHLVDIYTWQSVYLIDNTYQELKNSGNFAVISIDSIKNDLLNFDLLYEKQDIGSMSRNYVFQQSNRKMGALGSIKEETFGDIFEDQKQKNGFTFAAFNFELMNGLFLDKNKKCKEIISLIDNELAR